MLGITIPFLLHSYVGLTKLVASAVNFMAFPEQVSNWVAETAGTATN